MMEAKTTEILKTTMGITTSMRNAVVKHEQHALPQRRRSVASPRGLLQPPAPTQTHVHVRPQLHRRGRRRRTSLLLELASHLPVATTLLGVVE